MSHGRPPTDAVADLVSGVGSDTDESCQLLPFFDGETVVDIEHSLLPVCVVGLRSWREGGGEPHDSCNTSNHF